MIMSTSVTLGCCKNWFEAVAVVTYDEEKAAGNKSDLGAYFIVISFPSFFHH